ncbi:hypothetical protein Taro_022296 [Colocasia esculenta]|uniref:Uncharacterized protein n=1 Tax=Colocasia esculenta TaxID=4460 RepID=A0A843UU16_COLES|nr:hypothetical protein [Colocasia esculenta]
MFIPLEAPDTPDVTTFYDLRLDYGTYPAVATPDTSNVVNVPQKEAGLRFENVGHRGPMRAWKPDFEIVRAWKPDLKL